MLITSSKMFNARFLLAMSVKHDKVLITFPYAVRLINTINSLSYRGL